MSAAKTNAKPSDLINQQNIVTNFNKSCNNSSNTQKRLLQYLKAERFSLLKVIIMAILSTAFIIISPKIMGTAANKIYHGVMVKAHDTTRADIDFHYILIVVLILGVLFLLSAIFNYLQQFIMAGISQEIVFNLREEVNKKLPRLPLRFFDNFTHGEVMSRVINDIDNINNTLQQSLTQTITSLVTLAGTLIMMLTISPIMTLIALATLPFSYIATANIAQQSKKYFMKQQQYLGFLNGYVEEMYTGHKIIEAFEYENKSITKFNEINTQLYQASWKAQFISGTIWPFLNFINNLGYVLICIIGGIFVTKHYLEIGDILAFIQYVWQFTAPIMQIASISNIIQSTLASATRVFELLDEIEESPEQENTKVMPPPTGDIEFHNVHFRYKKEIPLIENISFKVKQGQTVAIVGPTGAGKTTLINLLIRFYELDDGKITINGINIHDYKRNELRSSFGMVLQNTWLFNGSIRDNICYGCTGATEEEIIKAAKAAHADHFIRALPNGYQTIISDESSNISQGEKQLLTIARAFLLDPPILILDEATSSVDTRTEVYIQTGIHKLMKGRTSFIIAHRLSTIQNADLILVMNNGTIVETGTHNELLAKETFYKNLYNKQYHIFSNFIS